MCFYSQQSKTAQELRHRFDANFRQEGSYLPAPYNGFEHPKTPIIINAYPSDIQLYSWGLIPHWAKEKDIWNQTLNARIETISEKPSFRDCVHHRCLVLADGFFEWKWLDEKGKKKQKYRITLPDQEAFAFAGLYSRWVDKSTGEVFDTYTILTTEANELMSEIHNSKKRMPVILHPDLEKAWLSGKIDETGKVELLATEI